MRHRYPPPPEHAGTSPSSRPKPSKVVTAMAPAASLDGATKRYGSITA
jgi:hypothetical protein